MEFSLPLDVRRIAAALAGSPIGGAIQVHEELESSNDLAKKLGEEGHPHGTVVFAEHQSMGRGRRENVWTASARKNLLFSVLLRPTAGMEFWPRITTLAALALCRAIEGQTALVPAIKWPNDVYVDDRKCAGILAETFHSPQSAFLVLGMGLNVNEGRFPAELREVATSLHQASGGAEIDRNTLAIAILRQLSQLSLRMDGEFSGLIAEVRRRSWLLGKRISARMNGLWIEGDAVDLNDEGHLVLRNKDETVVLTSAEQVRPRP